MPLDTSSRDSIGRFAHQVAERHGGSIGTLVNNAGIAAPSWSQRDWDANLATNALGPALLTQQLLPALAPGSAVVMVSSCACVLGLDAAPRLAFAPCCTHWRPVALTFRAPPAAAAGGQSKILTPDYATAIDRCVDLQQLWSKVSAGRCGY
jgi:NAD(P)-dependent dehydrogenase (short-subunit alcohol dehydrogenase family)